VTSDRTGDDPASAATPEQAVDPSLRLDADRVRSAREAVGAKEAELLDLTGRTRTEWRALMRGDEEPELREVISIAKALERTVDDLCA
jgi:hypothetical protein